MSSKENDSTSEIALSGIWCEIDATLGWSNNNVAGSSTENSQLSCYTSSDAARESIPASINGASVLISWPILCYTTDDIVHLTSSCDRRSLLIFKVEGRWSFVVPETTEHVCVFLIFTDNTIGLLWACLVTYPVIEEILGWSNSNVAGRSILKSSVSYYTSSDAARESIPASIKGTSAKTMLPKDSATIEPIAVSTCPCWSDTAFTSWFDSIFVAIDFPELTATMSFENN